MSKLVPTYVREKGEIFAFFEGSVIAHGTKFAKVEETAVEYLDNLSKNRQATAEEKVKKAATHVETPNGVKGEILGRTEGLWGDKELTVRFENGRIAKFSAHGEELQYSNERTAATPANPVDALKSELDANYDHDVGSLTERIASVEKIIDDASHILRKGASYTDEQQLQKITVLAEHEKAEIGEALAYLRQADAEALASVAPFEYGVRGQADLGRADSWLDHTAREMIAESEEQNFDKLLDEGPGQFTAELETGTLADQGSTAEMALSHITSKTAGFEGDEVLAYREKFVAAAELARRAELADRMEANKKTAAAKEDESNDFPDDALFI